MAVRKNILLRNTARGGSSPLTYSNRAVDERVSTDISSAIEILVQSEGRALR